MFCCHYQSFSWTNINMKLTEISSSTDFLQRQTVLWLKMIRIIILFWHVDFFKIIYFCQVNCLDNFVCFLTLIPSETSMNLCVRERGKCDEVQTCSISLTAEAFCLLLFCNCEHIYSSFVASLCAAASRWQEAVLDTYSLFLKLRNTLINANEMKTRAGRVLGVISETEGKQKNKYIKKTENDSLFGHLGERKEKEIFPSYHFVT